MSNGERCFWFAAACILAPLLILYSTMVHSTDYKALGCTERERRELNKLEDRAWGKGYISSLEI